MKLWGTRALLCASTMVGLGGCHESVPGDEEQETDGIGEDDGDEGDDSGSNNDDGPQVGGPGECVEVQGFFREQVWASFMSNQCFACHNPLGEARHTDLVLQAPDVPGFEAANLAAVRNVARLEIDDVSLLLLKPLGDVEHAGGIQIERNDERHEALKELVALFGESDHNCTDDVDVGEYFAGVELLDDVETLRRAAFIIASRLPTPAELVKVEQAGRAGLVEVLRTMTTENAFYGRVIEMFNQTLLTDKYLGGTNALDLLSTNDFPNRDWFNSLPEAQIGTARSRSNTALAREPLELIRYIVENDLPVTDVVAADYTVANGYLARVYGADTSIWENVDDTSEWHAIQLETVPHAGVLTTPAFLNRYPTTETNRNRMRAATTLNLFLATDVMLLGARPISAEAQSEHNPTMDNPECTSCHEIMDPVAGAFQNWNENGRYRPDTWHTDMRAPGIGDEVMPAEDYPNSLQWLGSRIAGDVRFARAMVEMVWEGLSGQPALQQPTDPSAANYSALIKAFGVQDKLFKDIGDRFIDSGYDMRELVVALVLSPYFRAVNVETIDEQRQLELADIGALHLSSPEQLHRRIAAVTGLPWRDAENKNLLTRSRPLHLMYGGINSDSVTEGFEDVNGVMVNIARRMANEMSCKATALDFSRPKEERVLFNYVTVDSIPGVEDDAIAANIRYLHERILGERLPVDDERVQDTVALFTHVYEDGVSGMALGEYPSTLLGQCSATVDPMTDPLGTDVIEDPNYTVRAWSAVISAMLGDFRFIYE